MGYFSQMYTNISALVADGKINSFGWFQSVYLQSAQWTGERVWTEIYTRWWNECMFEMAADVHPSVDLHKRPLIK